MNKRLPYGPGSYPCPECGASTSITDSRPTDALGFRAIRRRRRCNGADAHRFTTYEVLEQWLGANQRRDAKLEKAAELACEVVRLLLPEKAAEEAAPERAYPEPKIIPERETVSQIGDKELQYLEILRRDRRRQP